MPQPHVTMAVATANVLTLYPRLEEGAFSFRRMQLEQTFSDARLSVVGIQESRSRDDAVRKGRFFVMIASQASSGAGGMELWVHQTVFLGEPSWFVLLSQPRRLVVRVMTVAGPVIFVVLHALDAAAGEEAIGRWWDETAQLSREWPHASDHPWVVMVDGNCRLGAVASPAVGSCDLVSHECVGASRLHQWLLENQLHLEPLRSTVRHGGAMLASGIGLTISRCHSIGSQLLFLPRCCRKAR